MSTGVKTYRATVEFGSPSFDYALEVLRQEGYDVKKLEELEEKR